MRKILYVLIIVLLAISCTDNEGVNFQPDGLFFSVADQIVNENDGNFDITVNVSAARITELEIFYELSGTADYTVPMGSITIPVGATTAVIPITLIDNNEVNEQKDITVTITSTSDSTLSVDESDTITIVVLDDESVKYQGGILVSNQGATGSGTVSFISNDFSTVEQTIYNTVNNEDLGSVVQSIGFNGEKAYIVVSGSDKITVVNKNSFLKESSIETGLSNPRYFVAVGNKGYVTNWGDPANSLDDYIAVVDLATNTVSATLSVEEGPERIVAVGTKLYVSHKGGVNQNNIVSAIDTLDDSVIPITVGDIPDEMVVDASNNIWVLCEGVPAGLGTETAGELVKINTASNEVETNIGFAATEHPNSLSFESGQLYYSLNGEVYTMAETDTELPNTSIITTPVYTMTVKEGILYVTDAADMVNNGTLKVFGLTDNLETQSITIGVIPGGIYFN